VTNNRFRCARASERSISLRAIFFAFAVALLLSASALAKEAPALAEDPVLEKRTRALAEELRCLVCQNQTIADSNADLAVDLRNQIREKLKAGMSEKQVKDYMVQRYGDFVLYRPPVKATTVLLWFGPFALLLAGAAVLFGTLARRRKNAAATVLSEDERRRAAELLGGERADLG
jgi:cytochrome c-type biogenesis protein CcmH